MRLSDFVSSQLNSKRIQNFESKFERGDAAQCWLWRASNIKGYGSVKFRLAERVQYHVLAHRFMYALHYGPFDENLFVLHKCDNPSCVNPEHLFLGTPSDNTNDMLTKNRHRNQKKTHCIRGHLLSGSNLFNRSDGHRECLQCKREHKVKWRNERRSKGLRVI